MHGAVEFYEACQEAGIQPIIGLRLEYTPAEKEGHSELLLFAKNLKGYQQLMQLSSQNDNRGSLLLSGTSILIK